MLLGVEHIQFCVRDLAAARSYLEDAGYETVFEAKDFDREVADLPRYHQRGKTLVYLRRADSALELIDGDTNSKTAGYVPVLPDDMVPAGAEPEGAGVRIAPLDTVCATGAPEGSLCALRLATARLEESVAFWRGLGGRVEDSAGDSVVVSFVARIATMPLQLTLQRVESAPTAEPFVDELGCRLVAMLSTSLDADLKRIEAAGGRPSEVRTLVINGRTLRISFVLAPSGELVEIIEAGR